MSRKAILVILLTLPLFLSAQRRLRYRYELVGGLGVSYFLGDLGGANHIGTHGIKDLELALSRPVIQSGLRYKLTTHMAVRGNLIFGILRGDDKRTQEPFRNNRNLSFRSPLLEFSGQFEYFINKEQTGHRYKIKNVRGIKAKDIQEYVFVGLGGFLFNPKGKYIDGSWKALQPLGTEGQGIIPGRSKYSRISTCFFYGLGAKYGINRFWSIGVEFGFRLTPTDYIDDVSTTYATTTVSATGDPLAQYFADPSQGLGPYPYSTYEGQQRGDPTHKDAYGFITFTANYKFSYVKRKTRAKF